VSGSGWSTSCYRKLAAGGAGWSTCLLSKAGGGRAGDLDGDALSFFVTRWRRPGSGVARS
jgi:hypothetical protein